MDTLGGRDAQAACSLAWEVRSLRTAGTDAPGVSAHADPLLEDGPDRFSLPRGRVFPRGCARDRPDILLFVADDLAAAGLILSQFHTAPMCAPTRAMLLPRNDNHVAGMGSQGGLGLLCASTGSNEAGSVYREDGEEVRYPTGRCTTELFTMLELWRRSRVEPGIIVPGDL
jgi:hypothetical protein